MFVRMRTARPSDRLGELRKFYVDGVGCTLVSAWVDHDGYDGLIVADEGRHWEAEFIHDRSRPAPPVPSSEHLLVFYVPDRAALAMKAAALDLAGFQRVTHDNPYWARYGVTYVDPDGYHVVLAVPHGA